MGKKKGNAALGCLVLVLIGAGFSIQLIKQNPLASIPLVALLLVLGLVAIFALRPKRCEVCGNVIERKSHVWTIEGSKKTVCAHSNQSLARKQSAAATRRLK